MSSPSKGIGGYFELELPQGLPEKYPDALKYQSARAAFLALLQHLPNIKRVWMPYYICDSMLAPVHAAGKELAFYSINERFAIKDTISVAADDLLLYVNYFGVCEENVAEVLAQYEPAQLVIDCSQAFYSAPFECLATIYSPRKFFGVPDGGLLYSQIPISTPEEVDVTSFVRTEHLLRRLGDSPEGGYAAYQRAEESLSDLEPRKMSNLSERILASIDFEAVRRIRKENFKMLNDWLGGGAAGGNGLDGGSVMLSLSFT